MRCIRNLISLANPVISTVEKCKGCHAQPESPAYEALAKYASKGGRAGKLQRHAHARGLALGVAPFALGVAPFALGVAPFALGLVTAIRIVK